MLTSRAIGEFTGVSERTIRDWLNKGLVPKTSDMAVVVQAIIAYYKQEIEEIRAKRTGKDELYEEKTRLTRAQADKVNLEIAEKEGELVSARETVLVWSNFILACRSRLLGMPSKLAYEVVGVNNPNLVEKLLAEAVDEALRELGGGQFVIGTGTTEGDSDGVSATTATNG